MKVWFVGYMEQDIDSDEVFSYDNFIDSRLFATKELAEKECDRIYAEALNEAAENYQRRVARYQARMDIQSILCAHNPELLEVSFPYGFVGEFPEFEVPKRRYVYHLEVDE
jgi:hypothetical protein